MQSIFSSISIISSINLNNKSELKSDDPMQDGLMMPELSKDNYTIEVSLTRGGFTKSL